MKVTANKPALVPYNGYTIEISKPSTTYAYFVQGNNLSDSEGCFKNSKDALIAAKKLIDEEL